MDLCSVIKEAKRSARADRFFALLSSLNYGILPYAAPVNRYTALELHRNANRNAEIALPRVRACVVLSQIFREYTLKCPLSNGIKIRKPIIEKFCVSARNSNYARFFSVGNRNFLNKLCNVARVGVKLQTFVSV